MANLNDHSMAMKIQNERSLFLISHLFSQIDVWLKCEHCPFLGTGKD